MPNDPGAAASRLLTLARDLKRRKARERSARFVTEGVRAVEELVRSGLPIHGALATDELEGSARGAALIRALARVGVQPATVSEKDFRSAAGTDSPQGVLAIADVPDRPIASLEAADLGRVLVLDAIQDPGNVGSMIRTAAAMGVRTVVALPGTADPWNAKVVRSAAGGHFHVNVIRADLPDLVSALADAGVPLWGADAAGQPVGSVAAPARLALAVGNEGGGLTAGVRAAVAQLVALPMTPGVESLNVGVAAGVLLYALTK